MWFGQPCLIFAVIFVEARVIDRRQDDLQSLIKQLEDDVDELISHQKEIKNSEDQSNPAGEVEINLARHIKTDILEPNGHKRDVGKGNVKRWPSVNGVANIPYVFHSTITSTKRTKIIQAINYMNSLTPVIQWIQRTNEADFISFQSPENAGCASYLGKIGGTQEIYIGDECDSQGVTAHEMMHALGFYHEQSRPDRDEYVEILQDNIAPDFIRNFDKMTWNDVVQMNSPYDYGSVMHYKLNEFSKDGKLPTLKLKKFYNGNVGQRIGLSLEDVSQLKKYYGHPTTTLPETEPNTPFPETEATTPLPETEATTPLPETEATTPFPETEATTPFPETEATTPLPETEATTPLPETEPTTTLSVTYHQTTRSRKTGKKTGKNGSKSKKKSHGKKDDKLQKLLNDVLTKFQSLTRSLDTTGYLL
ncbi:zinc metalloproteinase nas-14-like isoform X2 [Hydractinia symbiolongicarpus]|uniref:zinc metalloproteinase nas-14-like isoform X2 n=1 Tax=Hydractinia symbiolongicarpus TaxID=13093 RepID=UPI00254C21F3|nr:zinc metalloproteinase nas-14-like isoform X2 [Hydractinia symbiolongicarpus]